MEIEGREDIVMHCIPARVCEACALLLHRVTNNRIFKGCTWETSSR